jgi:hypothetical protein
MIYSDNEPSVYAKEHLGFPSLDWFLCWILRLWVPVDFC